MRAKALVLGLLLVVVGSTVAIGATTPEQAAELFKSNTPDVVRAAFANWEAADLLQDPLAELSFHNSHFRYANLSFQGDASSYVLLIWGAPGGEVFWRLLRSQDEGISFSMHQEAPCLYSMLDQRNLWNVRLEDLTSDGIPEVLVYAGPAYSMGCLLVLQWKEGHLVSITPSSNEAGWRPRISWKGVMEVTPAFITNSHVDLEDLDGDGKAEVIVYPSMDDMNTRLSHDVKWVPVTPTHVYRYDGSSYVLWKEIPADDPYPISVPSIALLHPGTIPFSELIRFEQERQAGKAKASGADEGLRVFVSHPAGQATADDFETNAFVCDGQGLSFQKRWPNAKQPDTTSANWEWGGCPIRQAPCAKGEAAKNTATPAGEGACAHWNFSPEDPYMPSPDKKMEYHFVGPYLELRLPKASVYPFVYRAALDAFTKEPSRTEYFAEVPISGKMKNDKLAAVSALICVERTGNEKIAAPVMPSAPSAPAAKETPATPAPKDAVAGAPAVPTPATPAPAEPVKASPETK